MGTNYREDVTDRNLQAALVRTCLHSRSPGVHADTERMIAREEEMAAVEHPHRRKLITEDRRGDDRRQGVRGRRQEDRKPDVDARNLGLTGVIFGVASVLFAPGRVPAGANPVQRQPRVPG